MGSTHASSARANIQIIRHMADDSPLFIERYPSYLESRELTRESEFTEFAPTLYLESPIPHNIAYIHDESVLKVDQINNSSYISPLENIEQLSPLSFSVIN